MEGIIIGVAGIRQQDQEMWCGKTFLKWKIQVNFIRKEKGS